MEYCLVKSAERLEEMDALGTFYISTGGIYDKSDENAVKHVRKKHEISLHIGDDGNHFTWINNIQTFPI